jgi:hypothetical protein
MGRQYEYIFVGDSHYYGFLSYRSGECIDKMVEKGMINHGRQKGRKQRQSQNNSDSIKSNRNYCRR